MSGLVRVKRLSDRNVIGDPAGTWRRGDLAAVTPAEARLLVECGLAELADGEVLPPRELETATGSRSDIPAGERGARDPRRDRGSS